MKKLIFLLLLSIPLLLNGQTVMIDQLNTCDDRLELNVAAHGFNVIGAVSMKISFDEEIIYDSIFNLSPRFQSGFCIYNFNQTENALYFSWFDPIYWFICADTMLFFNIKCHRIDYNYIIQNVYFDQTCTYCNEIGDSAGIVQPTQWINGYIVCNTTGLPLEINNNKLNINKESFDILGRKNSNKKLKLNKKNIVIHNF